MKELTILKYQAETIENALRLAIITLGIETGETAMCRELLMAQMYIKNVLNSNKHETTNK